MKQSDWELAEAVALELVERETDVNEVQKVATHVRVQAERAPERVGADFFMLLETMVRDGRHLVRSGRTLDYYRDLREVCSRHLRGFKSTTQESGWELVGILGWAARLMRYYKSPEGNTELSSRPSGAVRGESRGGLSPDQSSSQAERLTAAPEVVLPKQQTSAKPTALPKARPREETVRELVTLVSAAKAGKARVRTRTGEEVTCSGIPSYPPATVGEDCRADVRRKDGRAVKAMFKGWAS